MQGTSNNVVILGISADKESEVIREEKVRKGGALIGDPDEVPSFGGG